MNVDPLKPLELDKIPRLDHPYCGYCALSVPWETKWFLKLYQEGPDATGKYRLNLEYICPRCRYFTSLRYACSDGTEFIKWFDLYTDTQEAND